MVFLELGKNAHDSTLSLDHYYHHIPEFLHNNFLTSFSKQNTGVVYFFLTTKCRTRRAEEGIIWLKLLAFFSKKSQILSCSRYTKFIWKRHIGLPPKPEKCLPEITILDNNYILIAEEIGAKVFLVMECSSTILFSKSFAAHITWYSGLGLSRLSNR